MNRGSDFSSFSQKYAPSSFLCRCKHPAVLGRNYEMCLFINVFISLLCVAFNSVLVYVLCYYFRQTSESKLKYEKICDERKASDYAVFSIVSVLTSVCVLLQTFTGHREI